MCVDDHLQYVDKINLAFISRMTRHADHCLHPTNLAAIRILNVIHMDDALRTGLAYHSFHILRLAGRVIARAGCPHIDQENIMQTTDFIVHIDETLNAPALESIENDIRKGRGVVSAGHRSSTPHLVQVIYDSDTTHMAEIVEDVRHHGLHAQAVGL